MKALELIGQNRKKVKYDIHNIAFGKKLFGEISIKLFWPSDKQEFDYKAVKFYFDASQVATVRGYYRAIEPDNISASNVSIPELNYLESKVINIYKPDPTKLTQPGPVGIGEEAVNADVSNIVGFLDLMLSKYRRTTFHQIETDLSTCIPEFDEINLDDVIPSEQQRKQFGDKSFKRIGLTNSKQGITYWADELSEGTLYFLALLCIINQPNPPKLLLLEEPEKGIHPRRIREVMDFIFRLAEEKDVQIILTSHNEHVLDDFATRPEAVFVFDKDEEGATYVRNLQTDIIEPTNQRNRELGLDEIDLTTNLSENWLYGLLGGVPAIP
ncbi:hypothetical protein GCM10028809_46940 [Spirosoma gilvum]